LHILSARIAVLAPPGMVFVFHPPARGGATLGSNVFTPDGLVGTPKTVREWLGVAAAPTARNPGTGGVIHHRLLQGLTLGNDHPQYPLKAARETISGQWDFTQPVWLSNGTAALPALTFLTDPNTGLYRIGADNLGITTGGALHWDINTTRTFQNVPAQINNPVGAADPQQASVTQYQGLWVLNPDVTYNGGVQITTLTDPLVNPQLNGVGSQIAFWEVENQYGFRIRNTGQIDNEGNLDFYRHANSLNGVLLMRFRRE
jgi:hypothetical protein